MTAEELKDLREKTKVLIDRADKPVLRMLKAMLEVNEACMAEAKTFTVLNIEDKDFKFNREEANER